MLLNFISAEWFFQIVFISDFCRKHRCLFGDFVVYHLLHPHCSWLTTAQLFCGNVFHATSLTYNIVSSLIRFNTPLGDLSTDAIYPFYISCNHNLD